MEEQETDERYSLIILNTGQQLLIPWEVDPLGIKFLTTIANAHLSQNQNNPVRQDSNTRLLP